MKSTGWPAFTRERIVGEMKPPDVVPRVGEDKPKERCPGLSDDRVVDSQRPSLIGIHQQHLEIRFVHYEPVVVSGRFFAGPTVRVMDDV